MDSTSTGVKSAQQGRIINYYSFHAIRQGRTNNKQPCECEISICEDHNSQYKAYNAIYCIV